MESPGPTTSSERDGTYDGDFSPSSISPLMARVAMITPKKQYIEPAYQFNNNETFKKSFMDGGPDNGFLNREDVLEIFISRSTLSFEYLAQLFELVDLTGRNSLDIEEFCLGMHFLGALDSKLPLNIPPAIPNEIRVQLRRLESQVMNTTSHMPVSTPALTRKPLSAETRADMEHVRQTLTQQGHMKGELLTRLRVRYNIQPNEMAEIWSASIGDRYTRASLSPAAIDAMVQRIQKRIEMGDASIQPTLPVPADAPSSFSDSAIIPDFANLPQRIASPALSTFSSSSGTTQSAPDVVPFPYPYWRTEEKWAHTESSAAATSMMAPSSYAGSCFESKASSLRKGKNTYQPTPFRYDKNVPAGNQYISEDLERMRAEMRELKMRLSEVSGGSGSGTPSARSYSSSSKSHSSRETLDLVDSPSSTSTAQRILLLKASLRKSQDEARRAKQEVENLQELVAVQEIELSGLYSHQINEPQIPKNTSQKVTSASSAIAGGLEPQIQSVLGMMETLLGTMNLNNATNIIENATRGGIRDDYQSLAYRAPPIGVGHLESQVNSTYSAMEHKNQYPQRNEHLTWKMDDNTPRRVHFTDNMSEDEYHARGSQFDADETSIQTAQFGTYEPSQPVTSQPSYQSASWNEATGASSSGQSYMYYGVPLSDNTSSTSSSKAQFRRSNPSSSATSTSTVNQYDSVLSSSTNHDLSPSSTHSESYTSRTMPPPSYSDLYNGQTVTPYRDVKYTALQERTDAGYGQYQGTREHLPVSTDDNDVESDIRNSGYTNNHDLDSTYQAVKAQSSSNNPVPKPKSRQLLTRLAKSFKREKGGDKLQTWYQQSSLRGSRNMHIMDEIPEDDHEAEQIRQYRQAIRTVQEMGSIRETHIVQPRNTLQQRKPNMVVNNPDNWRRDGDDF